MNSQSESGLHGADPRRVCRLVRVRVRATGSGPDWVCLCETKKAIKENLQGQRVKNGGSRQGAAISQISPDPTARPSDMQSPNWMSVLLFLSWADSRSRVWGCGAGTLEKPAGQLRYSAELDASMACAAAPRACGRQVLCRFGATESADVRSPTPRREKSRRYPVTV
eukprot:359802-Chlamydomonas_euryale.AAC.6